MKSAEEIMEILEGFDLTASYRDAAELAGCSPNTVANWVAQRDAGTLVPGRAARRPSVIDEFLAKLEELVERVGAENTDTSCDLQILVYQATEAVSS